MIAERHDAVFVVGSLDETIMLRGMRYHPSDIENTVVRCHPKICEWLVLLSVVVAISLIGTVRSLRLAFVMYYLYNIQSDAEKTHKV